MRTHDRVDAGQGFTRRQAACAARSPISTRCPKRPRSQCDRRRRDRHPFMTGVVHVRKQ